MSATPAVYVRSLRKSYVRPERTINVLCGVDLTVAAGEWVVITGKSGCGKTTFLHVLGALDRADSGDLSYFGRSIVGLGAFRTARWRRETIGFIFQSYQLLPELSATENVALAGYLAGMSAAAAATRAADLLRHVGLEHRNRHRPTELSGGEQQRIGIARALMNRPSIILADEPTGNLDETNSAQIMALLEELRISEKLTIVMATHDRHLCASADRSVRMDEGTLSPM